ncbi:MAG: hypothetical protein IJX90_00175 [Blautia sp.]|nr:hypothetical protein [Blautia sp.]
MSFDIHRYLTDLENRLDEAQEEQLLADYYRFADRKMTDRSYFKPERKPCPSSIEWEHIYFNDTFEDYDKMLYKQLLRANDQLTDGGGELLSYRANFGTGLIPSMFGCEVRILPREQDSLPGPIHLEWEQILKINEDFRNGIKPDVRSGLGQKTIDAAHHVEELLKGYPKLQKYLHIYQPDTQGPCSLAEAIVGSDFYLLLLDEEDEMNDFIECITDTFIRYVSLWKEEFPFCKGEYAWDYGLLYKGGVMIREDATTNISSSMYEDYFMDADQKILDAFGGGAVHYCGHGDHLSEDFSELKGLTALNMSQPDMNDMDGVIYPTTIDRDIQIIGMPKFEVRRTDRKGIDLKGMVHVGVCVAAWMGEPEVDPRGED